MSEELLPFCECGKCGLRVTKKGNRFINGHYMRGKHHTDETKEKMVKSKIGENNPMSGRTGKDHPRYGKKHTKKSIEKMSKIHIQLFIDNPELRIMTSNALKQFYIDHPEAIEANHLRGIKRFLTQESRDKMSEIIKNSDDVKENWNNMRGGNDICNHHYIYDHSDLSKYTTKMTRSAHQRLHKLMIKSGIKVPHINIKETINNG